MELSTGFQMLAGERRFTGVLIRVSEVRNCRAALHFSSEIGLWEKLLEVKATVVG
jgi:hypothetical protein